MSDNTGVDFLTEDQSFASSSNFPDFEDEMEDFAKRDQPLDFSLEGDLTGANYIFSTEGQKLDFDSNFPDPEYELKDFEDKVDSTEDQIHKLWSKLFLTDKDESVEVLDGDFLSKFKDITKWLSSELPKVYIPQNSFFYEIDKILYGDNIIDSNDGEILPGNYYSDLSFSKEYVELCHDIILNYQLMDYNIDAVLLQLIHHYCEDEDLIDLSGLIRDLILSEDAKTICLGLKFLKISLDCSEESREEGLCRGHLLLMHNLQLNSPDEHKGLPFYIFKLARECFELFTTPYNNFRDGINPIDYIEKSSFKTKQAYLKLINHLVVRDRFLETYEQYYFEKICMSAKNNKERVKLLRTIVEVFDIHRQATMRNDINDEFGRVVRHVLFYMSDFGKRSQKIEDKLRYIDKYQGIKIDPFGGPEVLEDDVVLEQPLEEMDCSVEKCTVYDYFMRCLQILTILHAAFVGRKKIYSMPKEVKGDHKQIFRSNDVVKYVHTNLSDISKCGNLPWYIEKILRNCPFVILEFPDKDIIDGLIKILKNENVDEGLENKVYKALKLDDDEDSSKVDSDKNNCSATKKKRVRRKKKPLLMSPDEVVSESKESNNDILSSTS